MQAWASEDVLRADMRNTSPTASRSGGDSSSKKYASSSFGQGSFTNSRQGGGGTPAPALYRTPTHANMARAQHAHARRRSSDKFSEVDEAIAQFGQNRQASVQAFTGEQGQQRGGTAQQRAGPTRTRMREAAEMTKRAIILTCSVQ